MKKFVLVQMCWNIRLISFQRLHVKTHFYTSSNFFFYISFSLIYEEKRLLAIIFTYHSLISCRYLICLVLPTFINQFVRTHFFSENVFQISQNYILHIKFSEFYLCFHNSCEIWYSFSRAPIKNFLWCYYRWLITSHGKCKKECNIL